MFTIINFEPANADWKYTSPDGIYLFKVNNGNTKICEICSELIRSLPPKGFH